VWVGYSLHNSAFSPRHFDVCNAETERLDVLGRIVDGSRISDLRVVFRSGESKMLHVAGLEPAKPRQLVVYKTTAFTCFATRAGNMSGIEGHLMQFVRPSQVTLFLW
jgi:hypothetical protein